MNMRNPDFTKQHNFLNDRSGDVVLKGKEHCSVDYR